MNILHEAAEITSGDRRRRYGHPRDNFRRILLLWHAHILAKHGLDVPFDAHDVAWMSTQIKQARDMERPNLENYRDTAGYAETNAALLEAEPPRKPITQGDA